MVDPIEASDGRDTVIVYWSAHALVLFFSALVYGDQALLFVDRTWTYPTGFELLSEACSRTPATGHAGSREAFC